MGVCVYEYMCVCVSHWVLLQEGCEGLLVLRLLGVVRGELPQLGREGVGSHSPPEEGGRHTHVLPAEEEGGEGG